MAVYASHCIYPLCVKKSKFIVANTYFHSCDHVNNEGTVDPMNKNYDYSRLKIVLPFDPLTCF